MKFLLKQIEKMDPLFEKGGKLERLKPLWELQTTFLFTPKEVTHTGPHVRDSVDLKRVMIIVVAGLIPATIFGIYNAGYQKALAAGQMLSHAEIFLDGALLVIPIIIVSYLVGGLWEVLFSIVRKHPVSEGFLVTGLLFPLTLPPDIPLWQVAVGISFGVVIGKEIFGGTGMNILNPALTARVFVFFSFPASISGDEVWIAHGSEAVVDGFSGATALLVAAGAERGTDAVQALHSFHYLNSDFTWWNLFIGFIPGSIGETSTLALLIGAILLIITGVASWQVIVSTVLGAVTMAWGLNMLASDALPALLSMPPHYHLVIGGFALGAIFMATDPVSAAATTKGKWIYGFSIGVLCILIRVWNPAYPEGMMLAILFMNIFAPLIDHLVVQKNIKRRLQRAKAG